MNPKNPSPSNPDRMRLPNYIFPFIWLINLALIAIVLRDGLQLGFFGDGAGYVSINTHEYSQRLWPPYLTYQDSGHPLIFAWVNGVFWRLLGVQNWVANLSIWIYAALSVTALMTLTRDLTRGLGIKVSNAAAILSALALFSTPLFIGNATVYTSAIPHLAFCMMTLLCWSRGQHRRMTFWALLLVFTRLTGAFALLGLGLFDLVNALRKPGQRNAKSLLKHAAPYLVCAFGLGVYISIKLWVLGYPLTTISANSGHIESLGHFLQQIVVMLNHTLRIPGYSFMLLLIPIALAGIKFSWQRFSQIKSSPNNITNTDTNLPSAPEVYLGAFCMAAASILFYATRSLYPLPQWILINQALLAMAGVHATLWLISGARLRVVACLLLIGWCSLQGLRWHPVWVERAFAQSPRLQQALAIDPAYSLEALNYKKLYRELSQTLVPSQGMIRTITAWPTYPIFGGERSGFFKHYCRHVPVFNWQDDPTDVRAFIDDNIAQGKRQYIVQASWDASVEQQHMDSIREAYPGFWLETTLEDNHGNWIRLYRLD